MKKLLALATATLAVTCLLASCGGQTEQNPPEQNPPAHTHSFSEWEVTKNPTCSADGEQTRFCDCGEIQSKDIPALGHSIVIDEAKDPTCTSVGLTEGKHCSTCGATLTEQIAVPATGHSFGDWITIKEATETEEGLKERYCECGEKESESIPAKASKGLAFTLNYDENSYSVTGIGTCTDTDVVIPSTYNGKPVTSIGGGAFRGCSSLESVVIPDSVTSIGSGAFSSCPKLQFNEYENCKYLGSKDNPYYALIKATTQNLSSYTIHEDTKVIADYAFSSCSGLTSIVIPDSVISIGDYAFAYCSSLTSVIIGNSVTSISYKTFYCCSELQFNEYENCQYLGSKDNPYYALIIFTIQDLSSYTIHEDTKVIADYAFEYCCRLTSIVIPDSVTSIGKHAFSSCNSLESVVIPDSVTSIGDCAFDSCYNLESVVIGNNVTSIGKYTFYNCFSLTSVVIGNSVTNIAYGAFYNCSSLTSVVIGDSLTSIGDHAFIDCTSLKNVYISNIEAWYNISFSDYYSNPMCYHANLYLNGELVTDINIKNTVSSVKKFAFFGCKSLTSVVIPNSVTSIGNSAFSFCSSLTSVVIPDSVTSIGDYAFDSCKSLTSIVIPDSVTSIGNGAFYACSSLESVVIPDSVTSIGEWAFSNCSSLTSIKYRGTQEQWNAITKGSDWNTHTGNYTITYNYDGE